MNRVLVRALAEKAFHGLRLVIQIEVKLDLTEAYDCLERRNPFLSYLDKN